MPHLSPGLQFACETAANEAVRTRHQFVEPEHLFTGVCKLVRTLKERDVRKLGLARELAASLQIEVEAVAAIFAQFTIYYVQIYRQLRAGLGDGGFEHPPNAKASHSPASRALLNQAAKLAEGVPAVTTVQLVNAMLADEQSSLARLLREEGTEIFAL